MQVVTRPRSDVTAIKVYGGAVLKLIVVTRPRSDVTAMVEAEAKKAEEGCNSS